MRFVVDVSAVRYLVARGAGLARGCALLAPTLLRSQLLSVLHEAVQAGEIAAEVGRAQLAAANRMPIRLLGDAVLRRRAWELADELGWAQTYAAEYLALTQLQADAFVTLDTALAKRARAVVKVASIQEILTRAPPPRAR